MMQNIRCGVPPSALRRRVALPCAAFAVLLAFGTTASAQECRVTLTLPSVADGHAGFTTGDYQNGSGSDTTMKTNRDQTNWASLVRFDLSVLPAGVTIEAATLRLFQVAGPIGAPIQAVGRTACPATCNGSGPNGMWTESDLDTQRMNTLVAGSCGGGTLAAPTTLGTYNDVLLSPACAQTWLDHPTHNFGYEIVGGPYTAGTLRLWSTREGPAEEAPELVVEFVDPVDSDGDGVADSCDLCPGTPAGDAVDASGCGIHDMCPCDNPRDATSWKNHGDYVSCIAHATDDFVDEGLVDESSRGAVVSDAARSRCGAGNR